MLVQPPRCCNHRGTRRQNAQCRETGLGRRKPARKTSLRVGGRKRSADEPCAVALRAGRFYDARPRVDNQPREGRNASLGRKVESAARSESRRRLDSTNDSPHASKARARSPARTYRRRVRAASPVEPGSDPVKGGESAASQPGHEAFEGERSAPGPLEQSSVMSSVVRAQPERDAQRVRSSRSRSDRRSASRGRRKWSTVRLSRRGEGETPADCADDLPAAAWQRSATTRMHDEACRASAWHGQRKTSQRGRERIGRAHSARSGTTSGVASRRGVTAGS